MHGVNAPQVGWPTLQLVPFVTELKAVNVNVLGITSRKKTRIVQTQGDDDTAEEAARKLTGRMCFSKCVATQNALRDPLEVFALLPLDTH